MSAAFLDNCLSVIIIRWVNKVLSKAAFKALAFILGCELLKVGDSQAGWEGTVVDLYPTA